jgi:peptidyl-prolyl cis-trans isomerase C
MSHPVKTILREPLLHFAALGVLLFIAGHYSGHNGGSDPARYRIVIRPDQLRRIEEGYLRQYGTAPTAEQLQLLTDRYVHEEILYREGLALGVDREDEIIRSRIVQKVEFLQQDLSVAKDPTPEELQAYYRAHRDHYTLPEKRSFTHVYFSPDRSGDASAKARALQALPELRAERISRAPDRGDVFAGLSDYSSLGALEVARVFGESQFSNALFTAPVSQWSGPYRSGFGWHLLYVQAVEPVRTPPLQDIVETVRADFIEQLRERQNAEVFAKVRSQYTIVRPDIIAAPPIMPAQAGTRASPGVSEPSGAD